MAAYAERLAKAAGKSTNIEWVVQQIKIGGNGPLMAQALGRLGNRITYAGNVGWPDVHPVFQALREYGEVITLAIPGHTDAVEFEDGKIMHGKLDMMKEITWERLVECAGGEEKVRAILAESDLLALTNWTMVPFANKIYENLMAMAAEICRGAKSANAAKPSLVFFDLADPEKRTREDLAGILRLLGRFSAEGRHVILGLNHKEAGQAAAVLGAGNAPMENAPEPLQTLAAIIRERSGITEVVVHPRERAAAATAAGTWCAEGPFTPNPRLSTGAGDHFNGGYCHGRLRGLAPQLALVSGTATSGFYVRNGRGPSAKDIDEFLRRWAAGESLDF